MSLTPMQIVIGLIVLLVLVGIAMVWSRRRRTGQLKSRFGPEYDHLVKRVGGDEAKAETLLEKREKRAARFILEPLDRARRDQFVIAWRDVQAQFVDDPKGAVTKADALLAEVMKARGYPVTDEFERTAADLSVDHADVVQNYRAAHDIAVRHERGEAGTEDLRQAMIHYRALFDDLVNEPHPDAARAPAPAAQSKETTRG